MDLIANKKFRHAGKMLEIGDPFTAHPVIGRAYISTGAAREAEAGVVWPQGSTFEEVMEDTATRLAPCLERLAAGPGEYETRVMVPGEPIKRKRGRPRKDASI